MAKQQRGWGGKPAKPGRPRKLTLKRRAAVARYYVALCDIADSDLLQRERPYRDVFIRAAARRYRTNRRMVERCLVEFGIRRRRAANKKSLRTPQAKKILKQLKELKPKTDLISV